MIILTMTDCPIGLRGDLTKWLLEINPGVFVGQVSARVRDRLWERVTDTIKDGRATMVFNTNNEQRLDFRVHNSSWEPIDFDGIKLMLRPSPSRTRRLGASRLGFSKASKRQIAKRAMKKKSAAYPNDYVVIDIETSGLRPEEHEIIELGAVRVMEHRIVEKLSLLVKPQAPISPEIQKVTGITNEILDKEGVPLSLAMKQFLKFLRDYPVVSHNIEFDFRFLHKACTGCDLPLVGNQKIDTLVLSRKKLKQAKSYKLGVLAEHFAIDTKEIHRSLADCEITHEIYEKLIKL